MDPVGVPVLGKQIDLDLMTMTVVALRARERGPRSAERFRNDVG
jgi:hypothetical protein